MEKATIKKENKNKTKAKYLVSLCLSHYFGPFSLGLTLLLILVLLGHVTQLNRL